MKTKLIEAHDATNFNWGKFLVGRFDSEWFTPSEVSGSSSLLRAIGADPRSVMVFDLQTREGAMFKPGGCPVADLNKHKIWVCPMFEPFLTWLYKQDLADLDALPAIVNLGDVPIAMAGYRREGKQE